MPVVRVEVVELVETKNSFGFLPPPSAATAPISRTATKFLEFMVKLLGINCVLRWAEQALWWVGSAFRVECMHSSKHCSAQYTMRDLGREDGGEAW